jgi:hypothetical protein
MLWHLLRQVDNVVAYYEPCHDNLVEHIRGKTPVQESHYAVESYWNEYAPLMHYLPALHTNAFGATRLCLEASDEWPELQYYLQYLIDGSVPHRAVLQMNRVDFRLPWLRARFPDAAVVHLFRNPRDQWLSMTKNVADERLSDPDENSNYDLVVWGVALSERFPFLLGPHIRHSYERHYLIWKLSHLMGSRCSTVSLSYDDDFVAHPARTVTRLLEAIGVSPESAQRLSLSVKDVARANRPGAPSEAEWERMERSGDALLEQLGLVEGFGLRPLADIRRDYSAAWQPFTAAALQEASRLGALTISRLRSHHIDTVRMMRELAVNARNIEIALLDAQEQLRRVTSER